MELTKDNFNAETEKTGFILVDFWAEWCGPCQAAMPILADFEKQTGISVGKVNVDNEADLASQFRVMSIPTLILFKDGKAIEQMIGVQQLDTLLTLIEKHT